MSGWQSKSALYGVHSQAMRVRFRLRADLLDPVPERPKSGDWQRFGCLHQTPILARAGLTGFRYASCCANCAPRLRTRAPCSPTTKPRPSTPTIDEALTRDYREEQSFHARRFWVRPGCSGAGRAHRPKDGAVQKSPLKAPGTDPRILRIGTVSTRVLPKRVDSRTPAYRLPPLSQERTLRVAMPLVRT